LGVPFNIYTIAEIATSHFLHSLGFLRPSIKSHPKQKSGGGLGLGELLKMFRVSYNISATAGARDFKFGTQLFKSALFLLSFREHSPN